MKQGIIPPDAPRRRRQRDLSWPSPPAAREFWKWLRWTIGGLCLWLPWPAEAADVTVAPELQRQIDAAIGKGVAALRKLSPRAGSGEGSIISYALLKAHVPPNDPFVQNQKSGVLQKIASGQYATGQNPQHHVYEASCDAMLLEALDPVAHKPQLTILRDYLVRTQRESGAWDYPHAMQTPTGDTSITQYATLGLWAISRAQISVPATVWSNAVRYHSVTQRGDGGFAYHPYEVGQNPHHAQSSASMSAAGLGTILVSQLMLYGSTAEALSQPPRRKFGVLERRMQVDAETGRAVRPAAGEAIISRESLRKLIPAAERAIGKKFDDGLSGMYPIYFLYGCERAAALAQVTQLGGVEWYPRGVDYLLRIQLSDGHWRVSQVFGEGVDTAFALLFLTRATESIAPARRPRPVGGGLLVGGRGLPDDLNNVRVQNGVVAQSAPQSDLQLLLTQLEQPTATAPTVTQQQITELVDLDQPEQLIGQLERLQRLLNHPQPEVRQVSVWALARSNDIRQVPRLIQALQDPDLVVAWEASLGLCYLSRKPMGLTPEGQKTILPVDPPGIDRWETADPTAPEPEELRRWRETAARAWDAWYLTIRPYEERDDRRQFQTR